MACFEQGSYHAARQRLIELREESKRLENNTQKEVKEDRVVNKIADESKFEAVMSALKKCGNIISGSGMRRSTETVLRIELSEIEKALRIYLEARSKARLKEASEWAGLVEAAETKGRQQVEGRARDLVRRAASDRDEARAATLRAEAFTAQCVASAALAAHTERYAANRAAEASDAMIHQLETRAKQLESTHQARHEQVLKEVALKKRIFKEVQAQNKSLTTKVNHINKELQSARSDRDAALSKVDATNRARKEDHEVFLKEKASWQKNQENDLVQLDAKVRKLLKARDDLIVHLKSDLVQLNADRDHLRGLLNDLDRNLLRDKQYSKIEADRY